MRERCSTACAPPVCRSRSSAIRAASAAGLLTREAVDAVNRRVEELLGPFAGFFVCPHAPEDGCECRKPAPKLILEAAQALGVDPACCVVVGDRESDVEAARNAGAIPLRVEGPGGLAQAVERVLYWIESASSQ